MPPLLGGGADLPQRDLELLGFRHAVAVEQMVYGRVRGQKR